MPLVRPEDYHAAFGDAFNHGDYDRLLSLYQPDALLILPDHSAKGSDQLRKELEAFVHAGKIRLTTTQAVQCGDVAMTRAKWVLGDAGHPQLSAESTEILHRQPDGSWLVAIDQPFASAQQNA